MKRNSLRAYLFWAFLLAWILQVTAGVLYRRGNAAAFGPILSVSMFAPLAAAIVSGAQWKGIGWRPRLRGKLRYILAAWFVPVLLGVLGAALYYALFPAAFDATGSYLTAQLGEAGMAQLEASGMTMPVYVLVSCTASLTWAPWLNMFFAMGEEAGWRGVMYPALKRRLGQTKGRVIGGIIWGVWHWPIMLLAGYEYGMVYWGAPVTGPLLFCVIATAMGIFLDELYEKTKCIWVPALGHGAINAFAGVPTLFLNPAYGDRLLLGPLMIGVIGGAPLLLTALLITLRRRKEPVQLPD